MQYLKEPVFWFAVVIVAVVVNFVWQMIVGRGKLV